MAMMKTGKRNQNNSKSPEESKYLLFPRFQQMNINEKKKQIKRESNGRSNELFVVSSSASGGARVARMSTQLDVNTLPEFVGYCGLVATGTLNFDVKQEQVHCNKVNQLMKTKQSKTKRPRF